VSTPAAAPSTKVEFDPPPAAQQHLNSELKRSARQANPSENYCSGQETRLYSTNYETHGNKKYHHDTGVCHLFNQMSGR
jgi:hypothetical protein